MLKSLLFGIIAVVLLTTACGVGESLKSPQWDYAADGPDGWAELSDDFVLCGTGRRQSPVDIAGYVRHHGLPSLEFAYGGSSAAIRNDGDRKGYVLEFEPGNILRAGQGDFRLETAHWHSPSEHLVDGVAYPVELHLVHRDDDGNRAVVAVLYEMGPTDPLLGKVLEDPPAVNETDGRIGVGVSRHLPAGPYFRYDGSLTTPPCTEPVEWYVMRSPMAVSQPQVDKLLESLGGRNARPVQPIGGRTITMSTAR